MQWKVTAMLLGVLLVLGSVNATPWGLTITAPIETHHWICPYGECNFAVVPDGTAPTLAWNNPLMQQWFTINVKQNSWVETWVNENGLHWIQHPAINKTWQIPGNLRTLAIPLPFWQTQFYNDSLMNLTMCNNYQQCDKIMIYKGFFIW